MRKIMFLILFIAVSPVYAQTLLNLPDDSRSLALGGSDIAMSATPFSAVSNPAAVVHSDDDFGVALSYMMFQPHENMNHIPGFAAYGKITPRLGISLNASYYSYPQYDCYDDNGIVYGTVLPWEIKLSAGVSYMIIDGLSAGINVGYFSSRLGDPDVIEGYAYGNSFIADFSMMYAVRDFRAVLAFTNVGTGIDLGVYGRTCMPSMAKLGAAYDCRLGEKNRLSFSIQGDVYLASGDADLGAGVEYSFAECVFVRGGYHYGIGDSSIPSYFSAGAGFRFAGVSLSAAYLFAARTSPLLNTFNVTIGYEF